MAAAEGGLTPTSRHTGEERELAAGPSTAAVRPKPRSPPSGEAIRAGVEGASRAASKPSFRSPVAGRVGRPLPIVTNRAAVEEPEVGD